MPKPQDSIKFYHAIVKDNEIPRIGIHFWPRHANDDLIEDIDGLTFLKDEDLTSKRFYISLSLSYPLDLVNDDMIFRETMSFLKHSFKFYADRYKEEYAFRSPLIEFDSKNHQVWLEIGMRLKEDIA